MTSHGHDALRPFDLDQVGAAMSQFLVDVDKADKAGRP